MTDKTAHTDEVTKALDAIFEPCNRSTGPGLVVGVTHRQSRIYRKAFGLASVQQGVANSVSTRMRIGSTTKHFTCLAALLLAEDGLLDPDAPASTYLPELPESIAMPTLRHFMTHTSGYRCSLDLGTMLNQEARQPSGWTLPTLARQQETNFPIGTAQMYCNGGYHLISLAIERVAGIPFETFLQERILEPLGMINTSALPGDSDIVPGLADMHVQTPDGKWRRGAFWTDDIRGEGSMVSTVDDMLTWLRHLNGPKKIGAPETWKQMLQPATLENGRVSVYSLGLNRHDYRGVEVIHHGGGVIGGNSQMITVPSHALDIVIHVNSTAVGASGLAYKVIDTVLGDEVLSPAIPMARHEDFPHLVGTRYHGPSGIMIGFDKVGDELGLSFMNSVHMPILRHTKDALYAGFEHVALGPIELPLNALKAGADGRAPDTLEYYESGNRYVLSRLPGAPLTAGRAAEGLIGDWQSHDAGGAAQIRQTGDELVLRLRGDYSGWNEWLMTAWSDTAYGLQLRGNPAATMALTVERRGDAAGSFRLNGIRARRIRFDRS